VSLFVTFEGIEGSGKSTHLRHLATHLRALGHVVVATREPGGTPAGTAIRRLLLDAEAVPLTALAELLLYCADRAQHVEEVIRPALAAGRVVLCDRFSESTIAYQGYGRGIDLETVRSLDARARNGITPTLTFLLDCPVAEGLTRVQKRSGAQDRFEREVIAFHQRVHDGFIALAAAEPTRFCVIDAMEPADGVRKRVIAEVERRVQRPR